MDEKREKLYYSENAGRMPYRKVTTNHTDIPYLELREFGKIAEATAMIGHRSCSQRFCAAQLPPNDQIFRSFCS